MTSHLAPVAVDVLEPFLELGPQPRWLAAGERAVVEARTAERLIAAGAARRVDGSAT